MTDQTLRDALKQVDYLTEQLKRKDEEIQALKEALKSLLDFNDKSPYEQSLVHCNDVWAILKTARNLIELNKPEK